MRTEHRSTRPPPRRRRVRTTLSYLEAPEPQIRAVEAVGDAPGSEIDRALLEYLRDG